MFQFSSIQLSLSHLPPAVSHPLGMFTELQQCRPLLSITTDLLGSLQTMPRECRCITISVLHTSAPSTPISTLLYEGQSQESFSFCIIPSTNPEHLLQNGIQFDLLVEEVISISSEEHQGVQKEINFFSASFSKSETSNLAHHLENQSQIWSDLCCCSSHRNITNTYIKHNFFFFSKKITDTHPPTCFSM